MRFHKLTDKFITSIGNILCIIYLSKFFFFFTVRFFPDLVDTLSKQQDKFKNKIKIFFIRFKRRILQVRGEDLVATNILAGFNSQGIIRGIDCVLDSLDRCLVKNFEKSMVLVVLITRK